ncbi:TPA: hypothetical protein ACNIH0_002818, partial [Acinetobacter baumannii]
MADITLCPHYLVDYPYDSVEDIENNIINNLIQLIEVLDCNENIKLTLSEEIFSLSQTSYPWNLYEDEKWSGVLNLWSSIILPVLGRSKFIRHEVNESLNTPDYCQYVSNKNKIIFESFLEHFGKYYICREKHEEGIFIHESCSYPKEYRGFLIVNHNFDNLKVLKNSWLRNYPEGVLLPLEGDYKFNPPYNWHNFLTPIKNTREPYGYIDDEGKVWKWDLLHNDHWDVQLSSDGSSRGNYLNITPEGKLLE